MSFSLQTEVVEAVLKALERPEYKWRTVAGVAKETSLSSDVVLNVLTAVADKIVQSSVPSNTGAALYTTREHFRANSSPAQRLLGAIKNRAE